MFARLTLLAALAAVPAAAQDYAQDSEAQSWGLLGEQKARFTAYVTDMVCSETGDCPADCGAGQRQMILVRQDDGATILALKNGQPAFSGATFDLAPFCQQTVEVDGVTVGDPSVTPSVAGMGLYMVQRIRPKGGDWQKADRFTGAWAEAHPDAAGEGEWFRRDPRIRERIAAEGYLGLGPEADRAVLDQ